MGKNVRHIEKLYKRNIMSFSDLITVFFFLVLWNNINTAVVMKWCELLVMSEKKGSNPSPIFYNYYIAGITSKV